MSKRKPTRDLRPVNTGYNDSKGRQGWHLYESTKTYEDYKYFKDNICMETRRFYLK